MISTNNKKIYELSEFFRSHGMLRGIKKCDTFEKNEKNIVTFHLEFIFLYIPLLILETMKLALVLD